MIWAPTFVGETGENNGPAYDYHALKMGVTRQVTTVAGVGTLVMTS
jgi:hypothetical protein